MNKIIVIVIFVFLLSFLLSFLIFKNYLFSNKYCKNKDFIDISVNRSGLINPKKCFLFG